MNTRILAGVQVPDTPLITKAIEFAKYVSTTPIFNHVMRSWLLGQVIGSNVSSLQERDVELQAICAILHDLGWILSDPSLSSKDKRFEVDSANATRDFIIREGNAEDWDKHRIQLAWDAIVLHGTGSIAVHKETEVAVVMHGVVADFVEPVMVFGGVLTPEVNAAILKEMGLWIRSSVFWWTCVDKSRTPPTITSLRILEKLIFLDILELDIVIDLPAFKIL